MLLILNYIIFLYRFPMIYDDAEKKCETKTCSAFLVVISENICKTRSRSGSYHHRPDSLSLKNRASHVEYRLVSQK
jgi:hypothetical protein